jgi:DnaJ-class molecular chaperone
LAEANYSEQPCGYCKGTGKFDGEVCPICEGKLTVMVKEPLVKCQFCKGQGYAMKGSPCRACKGTGWSGVKKQ